MSRAIPTLFIQLANAMSASLVIPILPLIAIRNFGATPFQAISLESAYYIAKLISTPYLGALSDKYGRKPIFLVGQAGTFLAFILVIFCSLNLEQLANMEILRAFNNPGLLILFLARFLDGITGGNSTIARIYLTEILPKSDHAQALGRLAAMQGIGFIAGPAIGGSLANQFGLLIPFAIGATLASLALITIILFIPFIAPEASLVDHAKQNVHSDLRKIISDPTFLRLAIIGFLGPMCFAAVSPSLVVYVDQVIFSHTANSADVSQFVGWMYTLVGISLIITQLTMIKPLSKKLGESKLTLISQFGLIGTFLIIPLAEGPISFIVVLLCSVVAYGLLGPSLQVLVVRATEQSHLGRRLGFFALISSSANLLGPLWAGLLFQTVAPQAIWWGSGLLLIPAAFVAWQLTKESAQQVLPT